MTRGHRAFHRMLWPVLALIVGARLHHGAGAAPAAREPPAASTRSRAEMSVGFQAVQWNRRKLVYDADPALPASCCSSARS